MVGYFWRPHMSRPSIPGGVVHRLPADLKAGLLLSPKALAAWADITPLARNEWICWVTAPKKVETRTQHIRRATEDLSKGRRRPCCWPGCPHR
jgi:uncharacterized protein YdeI (YjbR/CyaY-like superfamily)